LIVYCVQSRRKKTPAHIKNILYMSCKQSKNILNPHS